MSDKPRQAPHLLNEPPILVYPTLAEAMGINHSIVFQQLHFLLNGQKASKNDYTFIDAQWWVYNSYHEWQRDFFRWLSISSIKGIFLKLEKDGLIVTRQSVKNKSDRKKWYTIDYKAWDKYCLTIGQNLSDGSMDKIYPINGQNLPDGYSETSTETSTEITSKESVSVETGAQPAIVEPIDKHDVVAVAEEYINKTSPPQPIEQFDMKVLQDVVAKVGFKFNHPKQLQSKSNQADVKRIAKIVAIIEETFPDLTDYQRAYHTFDFYKHWGSKIIRGEPARMPLNADSFGSCWREWISTRPTTKVIFIPDIPPLPVSTDPPAEVQWTVEEFDQMLETAAEALRFKS